MKIHSRSNACHTGRARQMLSQFLSKCMNLVVGRNQTDKKITTNFFFFILFHAFSYIFFWFVYFVIVRLIVNRVACIFCRHPFPLIPASFYPIFAFRPTDRLSDRTTEHRIMKFGCIHQPEKNNRKKKPTEQKCIYIYIWIMRLDEKKTRKNEQCKQ